MKNIHLIETNKPSRLIHNDSNQLCYQSNKSFKNDRKWMYRKKFNIYITNSEEIKEGDYRLNIQRDYFKKSDKEGLDYYNKRNDIFKKIILTTDQDLIADGVQAIDDEFLEWFVKNPSCEEVNIDKTLGCIELNAVCDFGDKPCPNSPNCLKNKYKIIIPKEELKKETLKEEFYKYGKSLGISINDLQRLMLLSKHQQERMYSEEEVRNLFKKYQYDLAQCVLRMENDIDNKFIPVEWFEQNKNK